MRINMVLCPDTELGKINKEIYGHFSEHLGRCIYDGLYVGADSELPNRAGVRQDVIDALRQIRIPVLRWPGGCFADEYHWKDGVGPQERRKKMVNTNWGGVTEDNSFGTHEFMNLCEELGCEPYVTGNLGSGTVREMSEWIEYMTFDGVSPMADWRRANGREKPWKLKYFGIGNENWGGGGQMEPEYYADEYRRYQNFCKNFSGNELQKIACGPNSDDYHWTDVVMSKVRPYHTAGISLHYYTVPYGDWAKKGRAAEFDENAFYDTILRTTYMDELIRRHSEIMDRYDPNREIALIVDEWGCWFEVEEGTNPGFLYQQNTMRDAIVAAVNLNIFNRHCERVKMANIAQVVNVLQAVLLTEGEQLVKTPTYHIFDMYKEHQDATLIYSSAQAAPCRELAGLDYLSQSASKAADGSLLLTVSNCSLTEEMTLECELAGSSRSYSSAASHIVCAKDGDMHAHNTFASPEQVVMAEYDGAELDAGRRHLTVRVPACSAVSVKIR